MTSWTIQPSCYFSSLCAILFEGRIRSDESYPQKRCLHFQHLLTGSYSTNNHIFHTLHQINSIKSRWIYVNTKSKMFLLWPLSHLSVRANTVAAFYWTLRICLSFWCPKELTKKRGMWVLSEQTVTKSHIVSNDNKVETEKRAFNRR